MMSRSRTRKGEQRLGRSPVELVEEAVHLVRTAPSHLLLCYYVGTLPYVLALLYFWADMSRRGDARTRCAEGALLVAALFLWMKCWHTIFAQGLLARLCGAPSPKWTLPRAARMVVNQIAIQPTALVALPLSILALLPFAWLHAFYHNMTALDSGEAGGLRPVMRRAWAQAKLWPRQNHTVIWLISPALLVVAAAMFVAVFPVMQVVSPDWVGNFLNLYACIVALILVPLSPLGVLMTANFAFLMVAVPSLLKSLLGLETTLIVPPLNSTLLAAACSLTFVCMDPFMKAVYVLRCFYGESLATGEDLRAELRSLPPPRRSVRTLALVTAILVGCAAAASAGTPSEPGPGSAHVEQTGNSGAGQGATAPAPLAPHTGAEIVPADLDDAIGAVIQQREYVWRSPRDESLFPGAEQGPIVRFMERVYRTSVAILKKVFKWVARLLSWIFPSPRPGGAGMSGEAWIASLRALMYILIAALLVTILVLSLIHI